jgi:hypothetical protein
MTRCTLRNTAAGGEQRSMLALATVIPVGTVLGLLVFGTYGTHEPPEITRGRVVPLAILAVLLGPLPTAAFGIAGWLIGIVLLVGGILMAAMLRTPPLQH